MTAADQAMLERLCALETVIVALGAQKFAPLHASDERFVAFSDELADAGGRSPALETLVSMMDRQRLRLLRRGL